MREIVLDTETTGFEPSEGHRIVEIGAIELINHVATKNTFHEYLDPERDMPQEAFEVHGLSNDFLRGKPKFADVAQRFLDFIGDSKLIIHNATFDMKFLNAELERAGYPKLGDIAIDTLYMARRRFAGASNSLDALCRRFGVDNSGRELHGALLDSELLAEVYLELIGGRQPEIALEAVSSKDETVKGVGADWVAPQRKQALESLLSADEKAAHDLFVDGLKNPIWRA
ncbi:DNA polymerase III subunit epsilon [Paracoccaceae bacterium GXU_MW_L88]